MFHKRWTAYFIVLLPVLMGLILFIVVRLLFPVLSPVLSTIDFGFAGFVIGVTIRNTGVFAFVVGFGVTAIILLLKFWDTRHISQAQSMYADYLENVEQKRRHFLRRLDHEIKNPLTGLRAALVIGWRVSDRALATTTIPTISCPSSRNSIRRPGSRDS